MKTTRMITKGLVPTTISRKKKKINSDDDDDVMKVQCTRYFKKASCRCFYLNIFITRVS